MNELETILCKLLCCDRDGLYLNDRRRPLSFYQFSRLNCILKKRINGEPLQYLTREQEFMGLLFKVTPDVLIPRPETEILVQEAIERVSGCSIHNCRILDIGTGCGNIAIALAKFIEGAHIYAVDISLNSLEVARGNARLNHVDGCITFIQSDLFDCFDAPSDQFDFIVSNPPYILSGQYACLPEDVQREPKGALMAGEDGLFFYSRIEENARLFLKKEGVIFLEAGDGQAAEVCEIFGDSSLWKNVRRVKDYCGVERVVVVEKF